MSDVIATVTPINTTISLTVTPPDETPITLEVVDQTQSIAVTIGPQIGQQGPQGPAGSDALSYDIKTNWFALAAGFATASAPVSITGGTVRTYTYLGGATRYRFISTDLLTDAFYTTFNGSAVSGLVITKALQF
jgi:hypothetical protein